MATVTVLPPITTPNSQFFGWMPRRDSHLVTRLESTARVSRAYTDFSASLLCKNLLGSPSHKRTLATSILLHTIFIAIPLLLSVWFTNTLDLRTYTQTLLIAPPPPAAAPTPPKSVPTQVGPHTHRVFTSHGKLFMPTAIPKQIALLTEAPLEPESESGVFGGAPGGVLGGILEEIKAPQAPAVPAAVEKPKTPVPVGGNVKPPRILFQMAPEYPLLARQAGIQGDVIIAAIIDEHGNVTDMKVVSGPPLLFGVAMQALAQWKFEPTQLNGEPVPIKWNVSVSFALSR